MVEIEISKIYMEKQKHMQITKNHDNTENGNLAALEVLEQKIRRSLLKILKIKALDWNQDINIWEKYMGFIKT